MNISRKFSQFTLFFVVFVVALLAFSLVRAQDTTGDEEAHREALLRTADEGLTQGNATVLEEFVAEDYVVHSPFGDLGRDEVIGFFDALRAAFSDFLVVRENMVLEGDYSAVRTIVTGVFENDYISPTGVVPPNGQPIRLEIVMIFHFNEAGQIDEEWAQFDNLAFLTQLGAMPAPASASEGGITQEAAMTFAERFDAIFDGPNVDIADEIFAPDFVGHAPLAPELDRDGWKAYVASFYAAFPDLTETVNQVLVTEDRVVLYVTYSGTHDGPLFGIPATGKRVSMDGIGIFSFDENGLATENWAVLDVVGVLAQIGSFPPA